MAGKQVSRLTPQDRVLTANDLFDPVERPHGDIVAVEEAKALANHSTSCQIALGTGATAEGTSVAIGGGSGGAQGHSVAVGYQAQVRSGDKFKHQGDVVIGSGASARSSHVCTVPSVVIGVDSCTGGATGGVVIGPLAKSGGPLDDDTAIMIGTDCAQLSELYHATIRVSRAGEMTVGGKPVGGGGAAENFYADMDKVEIGGCTDALGCSVAVGGLVYARSYGTAVGFGAMGGNKGVAVGSGATTIDSDFGNVAVGVSAEATDIDGSVAVGGGARSRSSRGVAIGNEAYAGCGYLGTTAVGAWSRADWNYATAVGYEACAYGAMGYHSAFGAEAYAGGANQQALALGGRAHAVNGMAVGPMSQALNNGSVAVGHAAIAAGEHSVTVGNDIGNSESASTLIGAYCQMSGLSVFLRLVAGSCCSDSYFELGVFDRVSGAATSYKMNLITFGAAFNGCVSVPFAGASGVIGGNSSEYGY